MGRGYDLHAEGLLQREQGRSCAISAALALRCRWTIRPINAWSLGIGSPGPPCESTPENAAAISARGLPAEGHRKRDGRKLRMTARLGRKTTITVAWIGERLHVRAPGQIACLPYRNNQDAEGSEDKLCRPRFRFVARAC